MKYFLLCILVLFFIAPNIDKSDTISEVFRDSFYDYITCIDRSTSYLTENIPLLKRLSNIPYEKMYTKIMSTRTLTKHLVSNGETIDDIIKKYNYNITNNDLKYFRKIIYKENIELVSDDYNIQAGESILVPTE